MVAVGGDIWMAAATGLLPPQVKKDSIEDLLKRYEKKLIEVFNETFKEIGEEHTFEDIEVSYGLFRTVKLRCYFSDVGMKWKGFGDYTYHDKDIHKLFTYYDKKGLKIICNHGDKLLKNLPKAIKKHHKKVIKERALREAKEERNKEICTTNLKKYLD